MQKKVHLCCLLTKVCCALNGFFFFFWCVHVHQCTDVCINPSRCWQALESEFHIRRGEMFRHWQRTLKQTAHYSTMPNLFTSPDSTWPSHDNAQTKSEWMSISLAGQILRRSEFMEGGITRAKQLSSMNAARVAGQSMSRRLWLCRKRDGELTRRLSKCLNKTKMRGRVWS